MRFIFSFLILHLLFCFNLKAEQENNGKFLGTTDQKNMVQFTPNGGIYKNQQYIKLSTNNENDSIFFTTNGKLPDIHSNLFTGPIKLDSTTVIRAVVLSNGILQTHTLCTHSYFVNEEVHLPIISLVTDPDHLFSNETGIYVTGTNGIPGMCDKLPRNLNQDWERPVNIELIESDGTVAINQMAGAKIFGGCSRTRRPIKSFALFARAQYGKGSFNYRLFPDKPIDKSESLLLRPSADDQAQTMFRDALAQYSLIEHMDVDYQAYRPVVVFINGQYWGIHNIREKINEHYIESNFDVDESNVIILDKDGKLVQGENNSHYKSMIAFAEKNNLAIKENYEYIKTQMDIDQYIDYQIANIYLAERDWPGNNIKFWRADGSMYDRWRWLQYDRDQTFKNATYNAMEVATEPNCNCSWPNPPWSTLLFRCLLENETFRDQFIQLFAYHMATTFEPKRLNNMIDQFSKGIEAEIPRHVERWGGIKVEDSGEGWSEANFASVDDWEKHVQAMKIFSNDRPRYASTHIQSYFKINGRAYITLETYNPNEGYIMLYNKKIPETGYRFNHFRTANMELTAVSKTGYRFSHWEYKSTTENKIIYAQTFLLKPTQATLIAHFLPDTPKTEAAVIINEINYHSYDGFDTGDWIELHNRLEQTVDISDWYLKDSNDSNVFYLPQATLLKGKQFLVVCNDIALFKHNFPEILNSIGNMDFKLSNSGEAIRLYNNYGSLIDSVKYSDLFPWPVLADGKGHSLELIDPWMDNSLAENWSNSILFGGSPGKANGEIINSVNTDIVIKNSIIEGLKIWPNPVQHLAQISFYTSNNTLINISLYDLTGRKVKEVFKGIVNEGNQDISFNRIELSPGIYLCNIEINNNFTHVLSICVL